MLHSIKADLYRLFKSPGFYITLLFLSIVQILSILTESIGSVNINNPETSGQTILEGVKWTADYSAQAISHMSSILIYFGLPIFIIIIGFDLSRKTYKNIITIGITRSQYFLSKFIVFALAFLLELIFYYAVCILAGGIKNGWGNLNGDFQLHLLQVIGLQYINMLAIFSIATVTVYSLFSGVGAVITAVVIPLAITIISLVTKNEWFNYIAFQLNSDTAWLVNMNEVHWQNNFLYSISTMLLSNFIAYCIFKKKTL